MNSEKRKQLAINVAKMYYVNGDSQEHIAQVTGMSRSNISRILKKCITDGVVEIIVHDTISEHTKMARLIQLHFGLRDVIIVPSAPSQDRICRNIGERLSMYLMQVLKDGMTLGVARGRACYYTGRNLNNAQHITVDVVQLQGAVSPLATMDESGGLISLFCAKLNGRGYVLNTPLMVKSKMTKQDLFNSDILSRIKKKYQELDAAVFEIERPVFYAPRNEPQALLSSADILQLSEVGVVASVCGHYYNREGVSCNAGIQDRILAIEPAQLKKVAYSIGIAYGKHARQAVLSILQAGLINVLVIDENLAVQLNRHITESAADAPPRPAH